MIPYKENNIILYSLYHSLELQYSLTNDNSQYLPWWQDLVCVWGRVWLHQSDRFLLPSEVAFAHPANITAGITDLINPQRGNIYYHYTASEIMHRARSNMNIDEGLAFFKLTVWMRSAHHLSIGIYISSLITYVFFFSKVTTW